MTTREILNHMPFHRLSNFEIETNFQSAKLKILDLMDNHNLTEFIKENLLDDLFNPNDVKQCNYFDEEKIDNLNRTSSTHLNIFSMNIRSLPKHGGELLCLMSILKTKFDIIVLTEIGTRNIGLVKHLFENYEFHYVLALDNLYGGVGIYFNKDIQNLEILDISIEKSCHCIKCEMESLFARFDYGGETYTIGGIYRHPNGNTRHFVEDLEGALDKLGPNTTSILTGDINIDIIKFENDETCNYLSTLLSHRYLPYITLPTRITTFSATCIDHVFIKPARNNPSLVNDIVCGLLYCDISDHLPCFVSLKPQRAQVMKDRPNTRIFGERNCSKFVNMMESENWGALYTNDADWYTNFLLTVKNKFNACYPLVRVSRKRVKDKPWLTHNLKSCIKKKHKLYKTSVRNGSEDNIYKYKQYRNILVRSLKIAEELYYKQLFDDTQQSAYNLWKHLGPIINPNTKKSGSGINKILYNGHYITDKSQICNVMNEYFCGVGKKLQTKMPDCGGEFLTYLPEQISETFFLSPVVQEELVIEIKKLNPRKSCGPDDIGAKIIQLCPTIFTDNLSKIYNHSIEICDYPSELKIAKVIALFKKGEKFNPNNYRPISLLSCFNKLFEKLLCKRLVKFLERNQISFNYQYGFRKLHSTTLALIEFTDTIIRFLDEGNYCISVFIDLTKAFDTVDHEILLHKLERYGIRGHANMFLRSYLSNRHQYTAINDLSSTPRKVQCGVPQGSVLGPLLFALYINDIQNAVGAECVRLFADDTALYMVNTDLNALISSVKVKIQQLFKWCICNKLTINIDKTYFVLFHTINKPVPDGFTEIATTHMTIKRATEMKYLGLVLDEKLNYNEHVQSICNSLLKYFGYLII